MDTITMIIVMILFILGCIGALGLTSAYIVLCIYGFIQGLKEGPDKEAADYSSYSDYEEPEVYQNSNFGGTHDGQAIIQGNKITHTDWLGTHTGYSEIRDDGRIRHKNFWGQYDGHTEMRGDDRMVHYDEWGRISGYSVKRYDDSWRHEDEFGVTQSYSKKIE